MKVTLVMNGHISLVIQPENSLEKEVVKKLNGGKVQLVASGVNVLQNNIEGSLLVTSDSAPSKEG